MRQSPPRPSSNWTLKINENHDKLDAEGSSMEFSTNLLAKIMISWSDSVMDIFSGKSPRKKQRISPNLSNITQISSILLVLLALSFVSGADKKQSQQSTAATNAYGEPIKWSFGGWAPLDGQQPGAKRNQTGSTTPLPPIEPANPHRTTAASMHPPPAAAAAKQQQQNGRRPGGESLSESASSAHGKVQFVAPQPDAGRQNSNAATLAERSQQNHPHNGPAYAQSMQHPVHFSPPAPMPIVREHLLPSAANFHHHQQQQAGRGSLGPHHMPHHYHHQQQQHQMSQHHHHHQQQQQQQQQASQMIAHHQYPRPPVSLHEHQRRLEHRHREQMMRYHHMMMQHQRQQQQQARQPNEQMVQHHYQAGQEAGKAGARQPARFPRPVIEGYRVVEGEHPILFTPPAGMLEQAEANYTNQKLQQQPTASSHAPYASTMSAASGNEKEHLDGYQNALRQVTSGSSYDSPQSNNIQDIKQKQHHYEQAQRQQQQQQSNKQQDSSKGGSYLTIPVAVETEGDKVLTVDDINEIEKHVIQVLPNLKTADKVVKLADTKLTLASADQFKDVIQQQNVGPAAGPTTTHLHQLNYEEHRNTMKQLEQDVAGDRGNKQFSQQYEGSSPTTSMPASPSSASTYGSAGGTSQQPQQHRGASSSSSSSATPGGAVLNQATTNAHVQHQQPKSIDDGQQLPEQQYFLATGPMQEVGTVDPEQLAEYNLIKNDLLQNFRYEPTRASSSSSSHHQSQQQTASTPPMPYTASQQPPSSSSSGSTQASPQHKPASVTRYFQQGNNMYQQHQLDNPKQAPRGMHHGNLFGRINAPATRGYNHQQQQQSSTTKTILGGRKVSDVMRNLIHTTPVPMTSPMHVPSVEPEKVDAIQLIASHGNDNKPMVVEPHQLVQHTPEGGFDYNSGGMNAANNITGGGGGQHYGQQNSNVAHQYSSPAPQIQIEQQPNDGQQQQLQQQQPGGAIIEYVAVGEPTPLNMGEMGVTQGEGTYEIANQPEVQPVYHNGEERQQHHRQQQHENPNEGSHSSRAPFVYDYTMSADQQQTASPGNTAGEQAGPTAYQMNQQQQGGGEPQMFTWSPSIANEHQQQQAELSEHAAPGDHQTDMPATAGYNFFGQSVEQQQQQQQYQEPHQNGKWRSKAGGSQPNPDAQYDGQIVKGASDHESDHDEAQNNPSTAGEQHYHSPSGNDYRGQAQANDDQLARLAMGSTRQPENQGDTDGYQQKQQEQQGYQQHQQEQQSPTTPANQQTGDGYLATNSYAAGAQFNHQTPAHGNYDQAQEYDHSRRHQQQPARYNYVKLDHDRQQAHLAQQQAQRQAQIAEIMNNQQQQIYQTTTPVSLTTLASVDGQQQQQQQQSASEEEQQKQQQLQGQQSDYGQDQSLPSVQSSPESMLINESPVGIPILDQQSLISDPSQDSNQELSSDDGAKQTQPAAVYQVYQAYYAPKDHKPKPGYVRLSLEEFNELFRDAEIQYVDKKQLNGVTVADRSRQDQGQGDESGEAQHVYEQAQASGANHNDLMKASASEQNQSIVVDRRSIERRSSNATTAEPDNHSENKQNPKRSKFGGAVKKIISIRNSRQAARQQLLKSTLLKHKSEQQKKSNIEAASSTISPSFSPIASSNNPTTKQQPNVSTKTPSNINQTNANNIKQQQQQQLTDKRKLDAAASPAKKPLITANQNQPPAKAAAAVSKDSKIAKSKLQYSLVNASQRSTFTANDKSGSKATH